MTKDCGMITRFQSAVRVTPPKMEEGRIDRALHCEGWLDFPEQRDPFSMNINSVAMDISGLFRGGWGAAENKHCHRNSEVPRCPPKRASYEYLIKVCKTNQLRLSVSFPTLRVDTQIVIFRHPVTKSHQSVHLWGRW